MYNLVLGGAQWVLVIVMWGPMGIGDCDVGLCALQTVHLLSNGRSRHHCVEWSEVPPSLCRVEVRSLHHCAEWSGGPSITVWRGGPSITVQSGGEVPPSLCRVEMRSIHHCAEWR